MKNKHIDVVLQGSDWHADTPYNKSHLPHLTETLILIISMLRRSKVIVSDLSYYMRVHSKHIDLVAV